MPPFEAVPWPEAVLIAVALCVAIRPLIGPVMSTVERRTWGVLLLAVAIAQFRLIGPHLQILPAYEALFLASLSLLPGARPGRWKAISIVLFCTASVLALVALPLFHLPRPTGSYPVGTTGPLSWTDPTRNQRGDADSSGPRRELVVQIWYPSGSSSRAEYARYARFHEVSLGHSYESVIRTNSLQSAPLATNGAPFPVLLFGHRWGGSRTQDTFLAEELASHGYFVVAIDHPLNAARVQLHDGTILKSDRADTFSNLVANSAAGTEALWANELAIWTADDEFVLNKLDQNNKGLYAGRLDLTRVGAFGHSFGGASSFALLGTDPRVKCAVNLDGWTFQGLDHRTTQPILAVYEGSGEVRHPESGPEGALDDYDNNAVDTSLARYGGLRAYVAGTQHLDFTDQTLVSPFQRLTYTGPIAGERARAITRSLVVDFFDSNLKPGGDVVPGFPIASYHDFPEVHMTQFVGAP